MKPISLFLALVLNTSAFAATITVTNTNDTGAGSLRAAITAAVNGDAVVFSNTTAGGVTNFYDGVQRIITLGSALPNLSQNISLTGPGANVLTVRRNPAGGTPAFRIFTISNGTTTGPRVSISGLTLTNGNLTGNLLPDSCGAGILNDHGTLTVDSVTVTGNTTTRDGGGIYSYGRAAGSATLHVVRSSVTSNNANWGGGIYNDGYQGAATLTVRSSTVSNNTATGPSGGILNVGAGGGSANAMFLNSAVCNNSADVGGGIGNFIGSLTVSNCTLSGNSSARTSGAIYNASGGNAGNTTLVLSNSTVANNSAPQGGGCLFNEDGTSTATIRNTILQVGSAGGTLANNGGNITSQGHNLSSDNGGGFLTATGDKTNTNPLLGPLQDNGGPTQTHALLSGSPAIDAGDNTGSPTVDQRGAPRPIDGDNNGSRYVDIGAVEFGSTPNGSDVVVNSTAAFGPGGCDAVYCTFQNAVEEANSLGGANTITFHPLIFNVHRTATLYLPLENITNDVTIRGPGAKLLTVARDDSDNTPEFRIFNIPGSGLNVSISGMTIRNGRVSGSPAFGGGIYSASPLTLTDCVIADNFASAGGGVALDNSRGFFSGCTFSNNLASNQGGAINYAGNNATLTLANCTISGNTAQGGNGGGILNLSFAGSSTLQTSNCTIVQNTGGGGILTNGIGSGASAKSFLFNTIIANNTATNLRAVASNGGTAAIMSDGYNLTSDNGGGFLTATGDQINTNPLLGPLQDNGGPTPTHVLLLGSPAINSAHASSLTTDQRGLLRQFGSGVDKGAYELQPESYAFWASYSFPPDASPALTTADADYDGDGIPNGLEQALGHDPLVADAGLALQLAVSNGYLVLLFERSITVDPTKLVAEQSLTLQPQSWTSTGITYQVLGPASTTTELIQALIPINGAAKKFGRLRYAP